VPAGVVVAHLPAETGRFIGSPTVLVRSDGTILAAHDLFGEGEEDRPPTRVYRSTDAGASWTLLAEFEGQFWSNLFEHDGALYLMGTTVKYGYVAIRRSLDGGMTWTVPTDASHGLLRADGAYHTGAVPVVVHEGRLWRAMERAREPVSWPSSFDPFVMHADAAADLLDATSWEATNLVHRGEITPGLGWLEGNVVVTPDGGLANVLRLHVRCEAEQGALLRIDTASAEAGLGEEAVVFPMNGAAKKFTIRHDPESGRYLALVSYVPEVVVESPATVRNHLALASSPDLLTWTTHAILLQHADRERHGDHYADWQLDGEDLVFVSRTAYDDASGGAPNAHDSNYMTFHRLPSFRACLEHTVQACRTSD
jgi:hypothetical protein